MRILLSLAIAIQLFAVESALAQAGCTIPCCDEEFPYVFCDPQGNQFIKCSTNPNNDPVGTPAKAFIPGCVTIDEPMSSSLIYQPAGPVPNPPTPPDRAKILQYGKDNFDIEPPWEFPYYDNNGIPLYDDSYYYDYDFYLAELSQWEHDSIDFLNGDDQQQYVETNGMTDDEKGGFAYFYNQDGWLWAEYNQEETQYESDLASYNDGTDVPYAQVWSDAQASADAQNALNAWLNSCQPPTHPDAGCCIHVKLDANPRDWDDPVHDEGETIDVDNAAGFPKCGESTCPDLDRFIKVNITPAFLFQTNDVTQQVPDPQFKLHPSPFTMWYTGTQLPGTYRGTGNYADLSFFQLMEHEIGHWLGLMHPETGPPSGTRTCACWNCYTVNPYIDCSDPPKVNASGYWAVMAQGLNFPGDPPLQLSDEDKCQFQKLYCNPCGTSGVKDQGEIDNFNPAIYPNPTTGGARLEYTLTTPELVRVAIYDALGRLVLDVSSNNEEAGMHTLSLGTESLPSGDYVCRVIAGDKAYYVDLVIKK